MHMLNNHSLSCVSADATPLFQGRSQGEGGNPPPPKPKKLLQKNGVISEATIFSNIFSKKIKNKNKKIQIFYRIFIKNMQNFIKISQQFVFFVQTRKKLTRGLLNFFEKYSKIMHFQQFSEENFFKIFEQFLKISNNLFFSSKRAKN